jgi:uncharacterized membrane protein YcaP (DUF421 family)
VQIIIRATILYFFVWFLVRALGKKELSQLSVFEMILAVTIGDLIQQGVTQEDLSMTGAMLAVGTFGMLVLVFSLISYKSPEARGKIEGLAVIVVRDGRPVERAMDYERLTLDELKDAARSQGIADLGEIKLGILEPAGTFSFLKEAGAEQPEGEQPSDRTE